MRLIYIKFDVMQIILLCIRNYWTIIRRDSNDIRPRESQNNSIASYDDPRLRSVWNIAHIPSLSFLHLPSFHPRKLLLLLCSILFLFIFSFTYFLDKYMFKDVCHFSTNKFILFSLPSLEIINFINNKFRSPIYHENSCVAKRIGRHPLRRKRRGNSRRVILRRAVKGIPRF